MIMGGETGAQGIARAHEAVAVHHHPVPAPSATCIFTDIRPPTEGGVHPIRTPSTAYYLIYIRYKVSPAVPLSPAVPASTRVFTRTNPPMGRDSPVNIKHYEYILYPRDPNLPASVSFDFDEGLEALIARCDRVIFCRHCLVVDYVQMKRRFNLDGWAVVAPHWLVFLAKALQAC